MMYIYILRPTSRCNSI